MRLNEQGAGIFVMVNAGDGKGRKRANVRAVRALFVDLDGAPLEPVVNGPIAPHMVTETSLGRWHAFWLVIPVGQRNTTPFQGHRRFQARGDSKSCGGGTHRQDQHRPYV